MSFVFDLVAAFLIGLGSSMHCVGMCGGIAAGFGSRPAGFAALLWFNLGRITTYCCLAAVLALLLVAVPVPEGPLMLIGRGLAGLVLIGMGMYIGGWWPRLFSALENAALPLWHRVRPVIQRVHKYPSALTPWLLGMLWGLLPCGVVYGAVLWSSTAAAGDPALSILLMFAVGMGTLPSMLGMGLAGKKTSQLPLMRRSAALMLVLFGLWTLSMPMAHILGHQTHSDHHQHQP